MFRNTWDLEEIHPSIYERMGDYIYGMKDYNQNRILVSEYGQRTSHASRKNIIKKPIILHIDYKLTMFFKS